MLQNANKKKSLAALECFMYPRIVREVISQFINIVEEILAELDPGILLVGSAARGELSWVKIQSRVELFSDLEFLVAVTNRNTKVEGDFKCRICNIEKDCRLGELFHINYTIIPWEKLPKIDNKFFVFESKQCGLNFSRRNVSSELPNVDKSNLNWKELNEVLLHRMDSMLYAIPCDFLKTRKVSTYGVVLNVAKNTLDVTTWLHPYEGKELTAGFGPRVTDWEHRMSDLKLREYISREDINFLRTCLSIREKPGNQVDPVFMLKRSLTLFQNAIVYCKVMNAIDNANSIGNVMPSIRLFDEYRIRRRIREGLSLLRHARDMGVKKTIKNILGVRKGIQANFSFHMLLAACHFVRQDQLFLSSLKAAEAELKRLMPHGNLSGKDFITHWCNLRSSYKKFREILS